MLYPDIEVRSSPIRGKGLFATKKIPAGTIVWTLGPEARIYTKDQVKKFSAKFRKTLDEYSWIDKDKVYYSPDNAKYFNHSCDSNVEPLEGQFDVAARDILPGEEITYDYSYLIDEHEVFVCNCQTKNCRKTIKPYSLKEIDKKAHHTVHVLHKLIDSFKQKLLLPEHVCWCGSDKPYNKCGMQITAEHLERTSW